jgi:hypothetical protein
LNWRPRTPKRAGITEYCVRIDNGALRTPDA